MYKKGLYASLSKKKNINSTIAFFLTRDFPLPRENNRSHTAFFLMENDFPKKKIITKC